jgi:hypothetical protein
MNASTELYTAPASNALAPGHGSASEHVTFVSLVRRHWGPSLVIITLAATLAFLVYSGADSIYRTSGAVMLAKPNVDPSRAPEAVIDLAAVASNASDAARALDDGTPATDDAEVRTLDRATLDVRARSDTAPGAERALETLLDLVAAELDAQQAALREDDRLTARLLTPETAARPIAGGHEASAILWVAGVGGRVDNPIGDDGATMRLLQVAVSSESGRARIAADVGPDVTYRVSSQRGDVAPIIFIRSEGPDPSLTIRAIDAVSAAMARELDLRQSQADVPFARRVFLDTLAPADTPVADRSGARRLSGFVFVLGIVVAGALAGFLEYRSTRARDRGFAGRPSADADQSKLDLVDHAMGTPWPS